jgi:hypothetical protein
MWLVYELNGYTHLENMQSNEVIKIIRNYRLVNFTFFRIDNQPVIMDNTFSQLFSIQPVLVGCVGFENNIEFTITSSDYINQYNDLVKPRYLVNKATFSFNSIYKK